MLPLARWTRPGSLSPRVALAVAVAAVLPACRETPDSDLARVVVINVHHDNVKVEQLSGIRGLMRFPVVVNPGTAREFPRVEPGAQTIQISGIVSRVDSVKLEPGKVHVYASRETCWVVGNYDGLYGGTGKGVEIVAYGKASPVFTFNPGKSKYQFIRPGSPLPKNKTQGVRLLRINPMNCAAGSSPELLKQFALPPKRRSTGQ